MNRPGDEFVAGATKPAIVSVKPAWQQAVRFETGLIVPEPTTEGLVAKLHARP